MLAVLSSVEFIPDWAAYLLGFGAFVTALVSTNEK